MRGFLRLSLLGGLVVIALLVFALTPPISLPIPPVRWAVKHRTWSQVP